MTDSNSIPALHCSPCPGYFLIFLNLRFYAQFEGTGFIFLQGFFVSVFVLWSIVQIYVFPFILEQTEPSIKLALRNSAAISIRFLGRTLGMAVAFVILVALSVLLPPMWVLLTGSVMAYFANWQTLSAIYDLKVLQDAADNETPVE